MSPRPTILIVDDRKENLVALRLTLDELDADVVEASSGNQALAVSLDHDFALAILDVHMPLMDGFELAELLRGDPRTQRLPIIFLTAALIDEQNIFRGYEAGGVDYLIKPVDPAILLSKVRVFLELEHQRELLLRSEQRLREAFEQSAAVVSGISDAVLVVDEDGVVLFANPASEQVLGRSPADIVGEPFGFPVEPDSSTELEIGGGAEPRYVEMRVVDFQWQGRAAVLASLRDTTDKKRATNLRARLLHADRLASIGQLAAGVAHEVNNPAAFIMANLESMLDEVGALGEAFAALRGGSWREDGIDALLSDYAIDGRIRALEEMMHSNKEGIQRIAKIVRTLQSFSRIEHDEIERVDLNEVVDIACHMTFNEIRHRARLVKELGRIPLIEADRSKLLQVLTNLLVNAAHAIGEGAAEHNRILVQTRRDGEQIQLTVEDTGSGIPESVRAHIFDPFFTTKSRDKGTGLGLSLSAEIIRRHGGEISVASQEGEGTRFQITVPVVTPMTSRAPAREPEQPPGPGVQHARVLVVDDEALLLSALRRMLEGKHEVTVASGGEEALQLLREGQDFDVVICDLMMPQVDGMMVYEAIHEQDPELSERIVFCSGGAFTARLKRFCSEVHNVFLDKPVSKQQLLSAVDRVAARAPSAGGG